MRTIVHAVALALTLAMPAADARAEEPPRDEVLWATIRDTGYLELYEYFMKEFPASPHVREAESAVALLKGLPDPHAPPPEPEPEPEQAAPARLDLDPLNLDVAAFQRALRERGCNAGIDDGIWGERTASAAQRFADARGLSVDPARPNVALFEAVLTAEGDACGEF